MSFSDLRFGWQHEIFDLYDVALHFGVELQGLDGEGNWIDASCFRSVFSDTDEKKNKEITEYENPRAVKYSNSRRSLTAKAKCPDGIHAYIFLGIPEDKQSKTALDESRIEYFDFGLGETDTDDLETTIKYGGFSYTEPDDLIMAIQGGPYAQFYAPSSVFDNIEKWFSNPNIQLTVSINRKGWYWIGPIGDSQIYLDTENQQTAEFLGITISNSNKVAKFEKDALEGNMHLSNKLTELNAYLSSIEDALQKDLKIGQDHSQGALEANMRLLNKLNELDVYLSSIKVAAWVIVALSFVYIAVKS